MNLFSTKVIPSGAAKPIVLPLITLALASKCLLISSQATAHAQGGVPVWTNVFSGSPVGPPSSAIAVDGAGNVYMAGYSWNSSNHDYFVLAYSNRGAPLWTNWLTGGSDEVKVIAVDQSGNVFAAGGSRNGGHTDILTIAYSNLGQTLWTNLYDGPANGNDGAIAVAVDSSGNVFGLGASRDSNNNNADYVTIKYSNAGVPQWTNVYDGSAIADNPTSIAVDGSGNVLVAGYSYNSLYDTDYVTIKYSSAGDLLWMNHYDGPDDAAGNSSDVARKIAVDSNGNAYVTGSSWNGTNADFLTVAYSSAGDELWVNRHNGPANGYDSAVAIAVDSNDSIFVAGQSQDDFATIKYSSTGIPLWIRRYHGPGIGVEVLSAIALDSGGNVFVTGKSLRGALSDYATLAYSNAGVPLWTNRYHGPGNGEDGARGIAVDRSGNVFVTGYSVVGENYVYTTIKYSSSLPPPRLDFQKLNNELVLSWTNAGFTLQTAPAVTGPFTNLPAVTSPYTNPVTAPQQFFRLIQ